MVGLGLTTKHCKARFILPLYLCDTRADSKFIVTSEFRCIQGTNKHWIFLSDSLDNQFITKTQLSAIHCLVSP